MTNRQWRIWSAVSVATVALATLAFTGPACADQPFYVQTNLVSDNGVPGTVRDDHLVNAWGIVQPPGDFPFWVNDNGKGVSTLYTGDGTPFPLPPTGPLAVIVPPPPGSSDASAPTGIVFNPTFSKQSNNFGGDIFIFATEDGTISGWQTSDVDHATLHVDNSSAKAVYKGLGLGFAGNGAPMIYATDFHNGKIDVFDSNYVPVTLTGNFTDPKLPAGYAPFGIANIKGHLFVTYAQQDADRHDDVAGPHHGFIDEFTTDGAMVRRFASRGKLNSPWGIVLAPDDFGHFGDKLLVGNFGNGRINAFKLRNGENVGELRGHHAPIVIDGLWGLSFGSGSATFDTPRNTLFFTAGPQDESHGLFGKIEVHKKSDRDGDNDHD